MAHTQRVTFRDAPNTYTVVGADHLPVPAVLEYLQFLRNDAASPHTIRAYAAGLAAWWTVLEHTGTDWRDISTPLFGDFLAYLRTGDLPGTVRIGPQSARCSPASMQLRAAAVLAFYRYHADANGIDEPYRRLYSARGRRGRSRYLPMLAGIGTAARPDPQRPIYTVRRGNRADPPVLLPEQVRLILDSCSVQTGQQWSGSPSALRDRLLFATLAETRMRLGEALSLHHNDWHHRLRHTRATELLNDGVPFHVVQRYLGHKSPEMTVRYATTLAATAEAEFLKHKKIGAYGAAIDISPNDLYEMTQLDKRIDRVLPNGVCLLPPLKTCDKGNACLSCGHFATDRAHLDELRQQRADTARLLDQRRTHYRERAGRELTDDNVWVRERIRELASLDAIIATLHTTPDEATPTGAAVRVAAAGAGTANRLPLPLPQIQTRGAHASLLDATATDTSARRAGPPR